MIRETDIYWKTADLQAAADSIKTEWDCLRFVRRAERSVRGREFLASDEWMTSRWGKHVARGQKPQPTIATPRRSWVQTDTERKKVQEGVLP